MLAGPHGNALAVEDGAHVVWMHTDTTDSLDNCFSDNTFTTSAPENLEALAPCEGAGSSGDWDAGALDLLGLFTQPAAAPPKFAYKTTPLPGSQENMPNATTAPAPRYTGPTKPDVAEIQLPAKPSGN